MKVFVLEYEKKAAAGNEKTFEVFETLDNAIKRYYELFERETTMNIHPPKEADYIK